MEEGATPEAVSGLLAKATKGAGAESAREYIGKYVWARLWNAVTAIANCPPQLDLLLMYKAEIKSCMKFAQDLQIDMADAEEAVNRLKAMFSAKIKV